MKEGLRKRREKTEKGGPNSDALESREKVRREIYRERKYTEKQI